MVKRIEHITDDNLEKKWCGKCKSFLSIINFNNCAKAWDKLFPTCKGCLRQERLAKKNKKNEHNERCLEKTKEAQNIKHENLRDETIEYTPPATIIPPSQSQTSQCPSLKKLFTKLNWTVNLPKKTFEVFASLDAEPISALALLDTGAGIDAVSNEIATKLIERGAISYNVDIPITLAGGTNTLKSSKLIEAYISRKKSYFLVIESSESMIIGYKTLLTLKLIKINETTLE